MPGLESNAEGFWRMQREKEKEAHDRMLESTSFAVSPPEGRGGAGRPAPSGDRVMSLEDGTGAANGARVNGDNNLGTESRYGNTTAVISQGTLGTSSGSVITSTAGRIQLSIQNTDPANTIFLRPGGGTALVTDYQLPPGEVFTFPPGVAFDGPVTGLATGANTTFVVIQYLLAS